MIRTAIAALFASLIGCGTPPTDDYTATDTTGTTEGSVTLDCTMPAGSCDSWFPAVSPFDGTYSSHSCVQWKDAPGIEVMGYLADNCVVADGAQEGVQNNLGTACPEANRVGGCLVSTPDAFCEITYYYNDASLTEGNRADAGAVRTLCEQSGAVYVE